MGKKKKKRKLYLMGGASSAHKGDRMETQAQLPAPQPTTKRIDTAMLSIFADVWQGNLADIRFSDCTKPLTIVLTPAGIAEVRSFTNFWAVRGPDGKVEQIMPVDGPMPESLFLQIWAFFKEVHKRHRAEALVFVWQHDETGEWRITVPKQRVSAGNVTADRPDFESERPWRFWGEVHSHHTMSAFFSGTDDSSERAEGYYFGVLGRITDKMEHKFRVKVFGAWREVHPVNFGQVSLPEVPEEWMKEVSEGHVGYGGYYGSFHGRDGDRYLGSHCNGNSATQGARVLPPSIRVIDRDTSAVGTSQRKVIYKDGTVGIIWNDGVVTRTNTKADQLSAAERRLALEEGKDWHDPHKKDDTDDVNAHEWGG